ncbi:MAG TPA: hypothetical protein VJ276_14565 [Thermoanaerobaculia bacterium]|nr:hypothetical protein [Thermoanaerobaculia bacterium]
MVQHVFVILDPLNQVPTASPQDCSIWTDDQNVEWKLLLPDGWGWDNGGPGGSGHAVLFSDVNWFNGGGTEPTPQGTAPSSGPDRRLYAAAGPGPATTATPFNYSMFVVDPNNIQHRVDPDIYNQPQP